MNLDQHLVDYAAALATGDDTEADRILHAVNLEDEQRKARLTAPDALHNAARWYASTLDIPVFPLAPNDKKPLIPRAHEVGHPCKGECGQVGHGLYDATTDLDQISAWWTAKPQANIGTRTGLTFDVIDIDGPPGYASYQTLKGTLPAELARAFTPRGLHLYVPVTGRGNTTAILPGVDYRGASGYVVLPPSRVGTDTYAWIEPLTP